MGYVEIVDKKPNNTVDFGYLKIGETFKHNGKIHVKICSGEMQTAYALSFHDNCLVAFNSKCQVVPVKCKLIVED